MVFAVLHKPTAVRNRKKKVSGVWVIKRKIEYGAFQCKENSRACNTHLPKSEPLQKNYNKKGKIHETSCLSVLLEGHF